MNSIMLYHFRSCCFYSMVCFSDISMICADLIDFS